MEQHQFIKDKEAEELAAAFKNTLHHKIALGQERLQKVLQGQ